LGNGLFGLCQTFIRGWRRFLIVFYN